jgi:hypothetical protein
MLDSCISPIANNTVNDTSWMVPVTVGARFPLLNDMVGNLDCMCDACSNLQHGISKLAVAFEINPEQMAAAFTSGNPDITGLLSLQGAVCPLATELDCIGRQPACQSLVTTLRTNGAMTQLLDASSSTIELACAGVNNTVGSVDRDGCGRPPTESVGFQSSTRESINGARSLATAVLLCFAYFW